MGRKGARRVENKWTRAKERANLRARTGERAAERTTVRLPFKSILRSSKISNGVEGSSLHMVSSVVVTVIPKNSTAQTDQTIYARNAIKNSLELTS